MTKETNKKAIALLSGLIVAGCVVNPVVSQANNFLAANVTKDTQARTTTNLKATLTESVYLRATTSWDAKKGSIIKKGDTVDVVEKGSVWSKVKSGNETGYVANDYLKMSTSSSETSTTIICTGIVNTDTLNVRSGGSIDYSVIGGLTKGTKVEVVSKLSNGWFKIKYKTGYGYVNGKYITNIVENNNQSNSTSTATTITHTATVNTTSLNVRKGGSTNYDIIGKLANGTKVEIVDKMANGWSKIKYNSGYGYVNTSYLTNIKQISSSSNVTIIKTGVVDTTSLNVRKGSSTNYDIIGKLANGTKVEIVSVESNGWYKIKYGTGYGYVSNLYIKIDGSNTGNTVSQRKNLNNFLFVGDSFTALLKSTIEAKNDKVYVHAKSGSMPSYWLDKVSSMPSNSQVDGVVLLIGVNGAGYESNKTDVKTLINKLSARYPNKTIYVQKIFPVGRNFTSANPTTFNQKIASLNSVIEAHCKTVSNAKFINTTSGFVDSNGYLINTYDGLHISSSYNNQFYNNIFNAVKNAENK